MNISEDFKRSIRSADSAGIEKPPVQRQRLIEQDTKISALQHKISTLPAELRAMIYPYLTSNNKYFNNNHYQVFLSSIGLGSTNAMAQLGTNFCDSCFDLKQSKLILHDYTPVDLLMGRLKETNPSTMKTYGQGIITLDLTQLTSSPANIKFLVAQCRNISRVHINQTSEPILEKLQLECSTRFLPNLQTLVYDISSGERLSEAKLCITPDIEIKSTSSLSSDLLDLFINKLTFPGALRTLTVDYWDNLPSTLPNCTIIRSTNELLSELFDSSNEALILSRFHHGLLEHLEELEGDATRGSKIKHLTIHHDLFWRLDLLLPLLKAVPNITSLQLPLESWMEGIKFHSYTGENAETLNRFPHLTSLYLSSSGEDFIIPPIQLPIKEFYFEGAQFNNIEKIYHVLSRLVHPDSLRMVEVPTCVSLSELHKKAIVPQECELVHEEEY